MKFCFGPAQTKFIWLRIHHMGELVENYVKWYGFSCVLRPLNYDDEVLKFAEDVKGFDLVDVYVDHSIGSSEVIDESELLHDYDENIDVEVISEHDDTEVEVVSEHVDAEVQGGNKHDDTDVQSGRDADKNSGDDDDEYVGSDGEKGSLSDIDYNISYKSDETTEGK
ncbi:unnamed protein product [Vicia faba]|uniref:Uncharacterized protein n=1 Tax=Vicia faba TaxID=3906 RepID=A0AAV0Z3Z6_VICFA|nr:unnamed protein product [Vicia faba]